MSQDPNNRFPQYLVLSEIQRRTANEKAYAAAQPQPTTTVAEEVVGEFMQPKGLQAGMPSVSAPTDSFSTEPMGMPASAPMQQPVMGMASGGLTAFAAGDRTSLEQSFSDPMRQAMLAQLGFPSGITDEQLDAAIIEQQKYNPTNPPKTARDLGDAAFEFMYGDEFGDEAMDYIGSIPVGGLGIQAARKTLPFIPKAYKGIKNYFSGPKKNPSGKLTTDEAYGGTGYRNVIKPITENPITSAVTATPILAGINQFTGQPEPTKDKDKDKDKNKDKDKQPNLLKNKAIETSKPKKEIDYDLVGLGGLIMGARNMSELGTGLAGLAERKQARADALLEGQAQQDYYRASAEKVRAELENLPLEQKFDTLDNITETLKLAREGEIELTDERKIELNAASQLLTTQILALQGINSNLLTGPDPLEAARK